MGRFCRWGLLTLVWVSAAVAVVAFFRPWISIDVSDAVTQGASLEALVKQVTEQVGPVSITMQQGSKTVTTNLADLGSMPTRLTGAQIPKVAHRPDGQMMLTVIEDIRNERELIAKSWLVYAVPVLAVLCAVFLTLGYRWQQLTGSMALACLGFAAAGLWKLHISGAQVLGNFHAEHGLWMSCWAYFGLGVAASCLALLRRLLI
jgi:hypothetical protein